VGLVWTAFGGEVQFVEATAMLGKGDMHLTGQLGDVIKESAQIALTWVYPFVIPCQFFHISVLSMVDIPIRLSVREEFYIVSSCFQKFRIIFFFCCVLLILTIS